MFRKTTGFRASWLQGPEIRNLALGSTSVPISEFRLLIPEMGTDNESDQAERAISTGKLNASLSFALTHPAYRRGGLPRLFRETSFRGGFPA